MDNLLLYKYKDDLLSEEINEFIDFMQIKGSKYKIDRNILKSVNLLTAKYGNNVYTPSQLSNLWILEYEDSLKYESLRYIRLFGQYLIEKEHPNAFTLLTSSGKEPRQIGIFSGPFTIEIDDFVSFKRDKGFIYTLEEISLKQFNKFCSRKENRFLTSQQLAEIWCAKKVDQKSYINGIRELGLYLTSIGNPKSFILPYYNGKIPQLPFDGYKSQFANDIIEFFDLKRSIGLKYRNEEICLKYFDRFCVEKSDQNWDLQQYIDAFIDSKGKHSISAQKTAIRALKSFNNFLIEFYPQKTFKIGTGIITGPFYNDILSFIKFKKQCGFSYDHEANILFRFDKFCALKINENLSSQQLVDLWMVRTETEHPNSHYDRISSVRVFGKYLSTLNKDNKFSIPDYFPQKTEPRKPYLFLKEEINRFFYACANLKISEKDSTAHIVLPAAFLFMYSTGVRTSELQLLVENVDLKTGKISIKNSKNGDRIIYLSDDLIDHMSNYNNTIGAIFPNRVYFFPSSDKKSRNDFSKQFNDVWTSNIPPRGDKIPRLYDLRHHFLYRNIELYMKNGNDINVLRPYLMRHMGHKRLVSFQYYFHLSPPINDELAKIKDSLDWMIPDIFKGIDLYDN